MGKLPAAADAVATSARLAAVALAALGSACGGGGGAEPAPAPTTVTPPPAPSGPNQAPVVARSIPDQRAGGQRPFSLDLVQGGAVFTDPDGDLLTYSVRGSQPIALGANGARIEGTLPPDGLFSIFVTASDGRGGSAETAFILEITPNAPPVVTSPNYAVFVAPGSLLHYDPTKGGATFTDPEGDGMFYALTMQSPSRGLNVSGPFVVGTLTEVGLVTFELKAFDTYRAVATDRFSIVVAAPEPPEPVLPATPYVYAEAELELPMLFSFAVSHGRGVFWDTPEDDNPTTNAGATLGRVLFYDKRLSVTNTHACGSCHVQANGFGSPERFDVGALGVPLKRHAMTLANSRFNTIEHWFSDLRATPLEALALLPIQEPAELGSYLPQLEAKLAATSFYPALFDAAFGTPEVTSDRIGKALGQFLRSLMSYRSKFDAAYTGELILENLLTPEELRGNTLFNSGAASCFFCHVHQVQTTLDARNNGLDAAITDPGVITLEGPTGRFRAPSLRNIAVSAPYMHDGRFTTLREVIEHYDHGVQDAPMLDNLLRENSAHPNPPRRLNLSEADKQAIEAFLNTLTDAAFLTDPKFSDPFP